jgi:hypothetical protein
MCESGSSKAEGGSTRSLNLLGELSEGLRGPLPNPLPQRVGGAVRRTEGASQPWARLWLARLLKQPVKSITEVIGMTHETFLKE